MSREALRAPSFNNDPFYRIHNISPTFNRVFSAPLYLASVVVLSLLLVLPYRARVAFATLINLCCNRPRVYLHYWQRFVVAPMKVAHFALFYFVLLLPYALAMRFLRRRSVAGAAGSSREPRRPTDLRNCRYQSD